MGWALSSRNLWVCKRSHIGQEIPKNLHGGGDNSAITSLLELEGSSTLHLESAGALGWGVWNTQVWCKAC